MSQEIFLSNIFVLYISIYWGMSILGLERQERLIFPKEQFSGLVQFIESQFDDLYGKLKRENFLEDITDKEEMSRRLAYYLGEINMIHPFRDDHVIIRTKLEKHSKINGLALI